MSEFPWSILYIVPYLFFGTIFGIMAFVTIITKKRVRRRVTTLGWIIIFSGGLPGITIAMAINGLFYAFEHCFDRVKKYFIRDR